MILLHIPPHHRLLTAHFLSPSLSSLCPNLKFWDTKNISKAVPLSFYQLKKEAGQQRGARYDKPLGFLGGVYTYCPFHLVINDFTGRDYYFFPSSPTVMRKLVVCICCCLVVSSFQFRADCLQ